jgi:Na+-transporting methylmalonyl-CoA/oxaloacetate decarboxylase gamma subunit
VDQSAEAWRGVAITYIGMPTTFAVLSLLIMLTYTLSARELSESDAR